MGLRRGHIKPNWLLLVIIMCDLLNGIVHISLDINDTNDKDALIILGVFGFGLPLIIYATLGLVMCCYSCYSSGGDCSLACNCRCIKTVLTWLGGFFYFIGDNLPSFGEITLNTDLQSNLRIASIILLVFAVLLYRILPSRISHLQRYCGGTCTKHRNASSCTCCPADNESDSLVVACTSVLAISVDLDTLFTLIETTDIEMSSCSSSSPRIIGQWVLLVGIEVSIIPIVLFVIAGIKLYHLCCTKNYADAGDQNYVQPWNKRTFICDMCFGTILIVMTTIAVGFFLIADNEQPLGCSIKDRKTNQNLRITFLVFSLIIIFLTLVTFGCRKRCCCVDEKAALDEVDITKLNSMNTFKLVFKRTGGKVTIEKDIGENDLIDFTCEGSEEMQPTQCCRTIDWTEKHKLAYRQEVEEIKETLALKNISRVKVENGEWSAE